jgi:hypothetical protein
VPVKQLSDLQLRTIRAVLQTYVTRRAATPHLNQSQLSCGVLLGQPRRYEVQLLLQPYSADCDPLPSRLLDDEGFGRQELEAEPQLAEARSAELATREFLNNPNRTTPTHAAGQNVGAGESGEEVRDAASSAVELVVKVLMVYSVERNEFT